MKKLFSFDAETNGLWGQVFAIGALLYDINGTEISRFVGRCPIEGEINEWVQKNVLPEMENIPKTHKNLDSLLVDFAKFYLANKQDADIIVHMGVPVESTLLKELHGRGLIDDFDGPLPLLDIAGNLQQAGENPTSVDSYVEKYKLTVPSFDGGTHNPLYDAAVAAVVYRHLGGGILPRVAVATPNSTKLNKMKGEVYLTYYGHGGKIMMKVGSRRYILSVPSVDQNTLLGMKVPTVLYDKVSEHEGQKMLNVVGFE